MVNKEIYQNNMKKLYSILIFSAALLTAFSAQAKRGEPDKLSIDGPYVIYNPDGSVRVVGVDGNLRITDTTYQTLPEDFTLHVTDHRGKNGFDVKLHDVCRPKWKYEMADSVFVISDPHGRMDCFLSVLKGNGIIDKNLNWNFGSNHLMIIGDVFDRGKDAVQIFWLIYKLEKEAEEAGGTLSFVYGNHEPMVLMNDLRYTEGKYLTLAQELGLPYAELFGPDTELGRWLCSRNTIQVIGENLYVHAGLSREFLEYGLSIPEVNEQVPRGLYKKKNERKAVSDTVYFLHGSLGPIWYRGLVAPSEKYPAPDSETVDALLEKYEVKRIVVGHTIFGDIREFYDGRVLTVNVDNKKNMKKKRGRAILFERETATVKGDKKSLRRLY